MTLKETMDWAVKLAGQTKAVEISQGALNKVPELFRQYFPSRRAIVITDVNTFRAAGEKLYNIMLAAGLECDKYVIEDRDFHAEWKYIELIESILKEHNAVAIAVGSGVINDVCKLTSHHLGQRYICVASAASADGYSTSGASIVKDGSKQTFACPAPLVIIGDVDVLCGAPARLTTAGYADLAAKIPAGGEWMIADLFGTEPIIEDAWHAIHDKLGELLEDAKGISERTPAALKKLFSGLTMAGVAMQMAGGSSRPLSCSDHLYSHIWDMTHHTFEGRPQLHGYQVAIGTLTMCAFFDELLKEDLTKIDVDALVEAWPTLEAEQKNATELFKDFPVPKLGPTEITKKWQKPEEVRTELENIKKNWPEISARLRKQVYTFDHMKELFAAAGAPTDPSMIGISRHRLLHDTYMVPYMRWRVNLFDLAKRCGIFQKLIDRVFGKGGAWEIK